MCSDDIRQQNGKDLLKRKSSQHRLRGIASPDWQDCTAHLPSCMFDSEHEASAASPFTSCTVLLTHKTLQDIEVKIHVGFGVDVVVVFELAARRLLPRLPDKT